MNNIIQILNVIDRYFEKIVKKAVILSLVAVIITVPAAAKSICMTETEVAADKIRFLQTQMMVAALQCRHTSKGLMPKIYNAYVKANHTYLLESGRQLSGNLKRYEYGSLSSYLTEIANRLSLESLDDEAFCSKMKVAGEMALTMKNPMPILAVLPVAYQQPTALCTVPKIQTAFNQRMQSQ